MENNLVLHNIPPVFDSKSNILILGSFPSVKSRNAQFFYHHPQNRFWKVLSYVFSGDCPIDIAEKKAFLLKHHIALWDVIQSCEIIGSSDSSIKNAVANDLSVILDNSAVTRIFTNGTTAYNLYNKLSFKDTGISAIKLPSTSPANAAYSLDRLCIEWDRLINHNRS